MLARVGRRRRWPDRQVARDVPPRAARAVRGAQPRWSSCAGWSARRRGSTAGATWRRCAPPVPCRCCRSTARATALRPRMTPRCAPRRRTSAAPYRFEAAAAARATSSPTRPPSQVDELLAGLARGRSHSATGLTAASALDHAAAAARGPSRRCPRTGTAPPPGTRRTPAGGRGRCAGRGRSAGARTCVHSRALDQRAQLGLDRHRVVAASSSPSRCDRRSTCVSTGDARARRTRRRARRSPSCARRRAASRGPPAAAAPAPS